MRTNRTIHYVNEEYESVPKSKITKTLDSTLEFRTLQIIKDFGDVIIHPQVFLVHGVTWNIDFKLAIPNLPSIHIECKAIVNSDFRTKLKLFRNVYPENWKHFYIVCYPSNLPRLCSNRTLLPERKAQRILSLPQLKERLCYITQK